jgi:hypothetical protein
MSHWTDSIIGERMAVDQTFSDRVTASQFSNAEWDLIMTATNLEMENADDPEAAQIVANTDNVAAIIPELEAIRSQTAAMAGQPGGGSHQSSGGLLDSLMGALGLGSDDSDETVDAEKLAAAEQLTAEYAEALQAHLEESGSFEQARAAYREA